MIVLKATITNYRSPHWDPDSRKPVCVHVNHCVSLLFAMLLPGRRILWSIFMWFAKTTATTLALMCLQPCKTSSITLRTSLFWVVTQVCRKIKSSPSSTLIVPSFHSEFSLNLSVVMPVVTCLNISLCHKCGKYSGRWLTLAASHLCNQATTTTTRLL